jgi:biopolymer transport protein ExbB/TolQ
MLAKHFIEGDPVGMTVIFGLWLTAIILIGKLIYRWTNKSESDEKRNKAVSESILFIGSFAFLFGLFFQVIGMIQALKAIEAAGDISMALIAGGLKVSLIVPVYGFVLFLISYITWFINRKLSK